MNLDHLLAISDEIGIFEHCDGVTPRREHGYCVDDVARAVIVLHRSHDHSPEAAQLLATCTRFLSESRDTNGTVVNRRAADGSWNGDANTNDHWGRALWAWGTAVNHSRDTCAAALAFEHFHAAGQQRSSFTRSMAFAVLGAHEVLQVIPGNRVALDLIADAISCISEPQDAFWPWPEDRLHYANAVIPEALIIGGIHLNSAHHRRWGLSLLNWLVTQQSIGGRLSVIPHNGWGPGESLPAYDQQPLEVAAIVDACVTAFDLTSDPIWLQRITMANRWFSGDNDQAIPMFDVGTGAGFDALTEAGRNGNCGAESTLAYLSVDQRAEMYLQRVA
jgi:hypothetical protein